jgi:GNAT superfamily N-acetyltransferase
MNIDFRKATSSDSECIGELVVKLATEIGELTNTQNYDIDLNSIIQRCRELITGGHYEAILGFYEGNPVAVVTMTETYALYADGKIGEIQEFYITPEHRASGLGSILVERVKTHGLQHNWSCIELCTPPLPEFERTLNFYRKNGLKPVGGRKMRQFLV